MGKMKTTCLPGCCGKDNQPVDKRIYVCFVYDKIVISEKKIHRNDLFKSLLALLIFGKKIHVYLDQSDDPRDYHRDYLMQDHVDIQKKLESSNVGKILCSATFWRWMENALILLQ